MCRRPLLDDSEYLQDYVGPSYFAKGQLPAPPGKKSAINSLLCLQYRQQQLSGVAARQRRLSACGLARRGLKSVT